MHVVHSVGFARGVGDGWVYLSRAHEELDRRGARGEGRHLRRPGMVGAMNHNPMATLQKTDDNIISTFGAPLPGELMKVKVLEYIYTSSCETSHDLLVASTTYT